MPYLFVLQSGIVTTVLALAGVYWLNTHAEDVQIMGWYANYVIPAGAILVGLVAGAGYGIASWWLGVRISRWLMAAVIALQIGAYFAAEYVEYRDVVAHFEKEGLVSESTGQLPGFWEYYDWKARSFQWKAKTPNEKTEPLGAWGYVFVGLAAVGFVGGGLIVPAILFSVPYCQGCQRYMKTRTLGVLPASVPLQKVKKLQPAELQAYEKAQQAAAEYSEAAWQRMSASAEALDAAAFRAELASAGDRKANNKLPVRVEVSLVHCRSCNCGRIRRHQITGTGDKVQKVQLSEAEVQPEFVRAIAG